MHVEVQVEVQLEVQVEVLVEVQVLVKERMQHLMLGEGYLGVLLQVSSDPVYRELDLRPVGVGGGWRG